jgi:phage/plasmid-like protein (TIGR03299 family)
MAHEFESGFVVREQAWHGLAVVLQDNPSIEDAIVKAGLDWNVVEGELTTNVMTAQGVGPVAVKGWKALLRDRDNAVLGVVTDQFNPFQNKDAFGWFGELVKDGTCRIETAGSLQGGRKVWVQARYADAIEVTDGDALIPYLLLANGHDGKMSLRIINTPTRVVCCNTMQAAGAVEDGDAEGDDAIAAKGFAISHKGDVRAKAEAARRAIVAMNRELKVTVDAYRKMAGLPVTEDYVRRLAKELFDADYIKAKDLIAKFRVREEQADVSIREQTRAAIADLEKLLNNTGRVEKVIVDSFHNGPGADLAGETAWGAFNAVTDYLDHKVSGGQDRRMASSWFGEGARKRRKAFDLIASTL